MSGRGAGCDLESLAADQSFADDPDGGVRADQGVQAVVQPQTQDDVASRRGRRNHGDDLTGIDPLDADARSDFDSLNTLETAADVEGVAAQPLPATDSKQSHASQSQAHQHDGAQQHCLPARE